MASTVLITGCSSGIGAAAVRQFAAQGARLLGQLLAVGLDLRQAAASLPELELQPAQQAAQAQRSPVAWREQHR